MPCTTPKGPISYGVSRAEVAVLDAMFSGGGETSDAPFRGPLLGHFLGYFTEAYSGFHRLSKQNSYTIPSKFLLRSPITS